MNFVQERVMESQEHALVSHSSRVPILATSNHNSILSYLVLGQIHLFLPLGKMMSVFVQ